MSITKEVNVVKMIYLYNKGFSQGEVAEDLGTTQKVICSRMKQIGFSPRIAYKRDQFGEKNSNWKGGEVFSRGYLHIKTPGHPRAKSCGDYVPEHVLVVERFIGRYLSSDEHIHHINGVKTDNRESNLYVTNVREHTWLHSNHVAHLVTSNLSKLKGVI